MNSAECHIDGKPVDEGICIYALVTDRVTGETVNKEMFTVDSNGKYIFTLDLYDCDPWHPLPSIYKAIKKLQNDMDSFNEKDKELFNVLRNMRIKYMNGLISLNEIEEIKNFVHSNSKDLKAMSRRCKELIKVLKEAKSILKQRCAEKK